MASQNNTRKNINAQKAFWIAVVASICLPFIPYLRLLLLPFDFLNTHFHEMFHAIAAIGTGGQVGSIRVFSNAEGVTQTAGGIGPVISMAGYLGASLLGAFIVRTSHNQSNSRNWLKALGIVLCIAQVIWVRGDAVGWIFGLLWGAILLISSAMLNSQWVLLAAQFVGIQQCLNSLKSLRDLVILSNSNAQTDAHAMQNFTHLPALFWALVWLLVGGFGVILAAFTLHKE